MKSPGVARAALALMLLDALAIGLPAVFAPRAFYGSFPFVGHWIDVLPPYNEHLVSDIGGLYLGFAAMLARAVMSMRRELVRAVSAGWALPALLHIAFHAGHLDALHIGDAIGEIVALALLLTLPGLAIWGAGPMSASGFLPSNSREPR